MPHVRGPWLPGCLAMVALFSLGHSQQGKEALEAGTGWGVLGDGPMGGGPFT